MANWYAIRTATRREFEVAAALDGLGIDAYVPRECVVRRRGNLLRPIWRPVAPGYVFALCAVTDLPKIGAVDGFFAFVSTTHADGSREPAALPPKALQWLFLAEAFGDLDETRRPAAYKPQRGDRVRVASGKWKGYVGRILSVGKRQASLALESGFGRLKVDNEIMERAA